MVRAVRAVDLAEVWVVRVAFTEDMAAMEEDQVGSCLLTSAHRGHMADVMSAIASAAIVAVLSEAGVVAVSAAMVVVVSAVIVVGDKEATHSPGAVVIVTPEKTRERGRRNEHPRLFLLLNVQSRSRFKYCVSINYIGVYHNRPTFC